MSVESSPSLEYFLERREEMYSEATSSSPVATAPRAAWSKQSASPALMWRRARLRSLVVTREWVQTQFVQVRALADAVLVLVELDDAVRRGRVHGVGRVAWVSRGCPETRLSDAAEE